MYGIYTYKWKNLDWHHLCGARFGSPQWLQWSTPYHIIVIRSRIPYTTKQKLCQAQLPLYCRNIRWNKYHQCSKGCHILNVIINTGKKIGAIKISPIRADGEISKNFLLAKISAYMVLCNSFDCELQKTHNSQSLESHDQNPTYGIFSSWYRIVMSMLVLSPDPTLCKGQGTDDFGLLHTWLGKLWAYAPTQHF